MMDTEAFLALRQEAWENDGGTGYVWLPNMSRRQMTPPPGEKPTSGHGDEHRLGQVDHWRRQ